MKTSLILLVLIGLSLWGMWWVICPDLKPKNNAYCKRSVHILDNPITCEFEGQRYLQFKEVANVGK
jgi:hypothetical protein